MRKFVKLHPSFVCPKWDDNLPISPPLQYSKNLLTYLVVQIKFLQQFYSKGTPFSQYNLL